MSKTLLTQEGFDILQRELKLNKEVKRPAVIEEIKDARETGGSELSENIAYIEARELQNQIESKIVDLEEKIQNCLIIDISKLSDDGIVKFGKKVTLIDLDNDKTVSYRLVGAIESNIREGKISYLAPLSKAMMGKKVDDYVDFEAPNGDDKSYQILKVEV